MNFNGNKNWDDNAYRNDSRYEGSRTKQIQNKYNIYGNIYPKDTPQNIAGIDCTLVNGWTVDNKFRRKSYSNGEKILVELYRNRNKYTGKQLLGRLYTSAAQYQLTIYENDVAFLIYLPYLQKNIRDELGVETNAQVFEECVKMQNGNYPFHNYHLRLAQQGVDNVLWQIDIEEMQSKYPDTMKRLDLTTGNVYNLDGTLLKNIKEEQYNESV